MPQSLQGVSVTIGGIPAPLLYVSPGQINLQVPFELPLGITDLVVRRGAQASAARPVRVIAATPGIFTFSEDGRSQPVILHATDYSPVTASNPAHAGGYLTIFCTGLGATTLSVRSGDAAPPMPVPIQTNLGVSAGPVTYAGLAPGFAGLYQINLQLNDNVTPGMVSIGINEANGTLLGNTVPLYIQCRWALCASSLVAANRSRT